MKTSDSGSPLDQLVEAVRKSRKYEQVCGTFVRSIGSRELMKQRQLGAAIKATKSKLHQVGGAYLSRRMDYATWLAEIETAFGAGNREDFLRTCARIMSCHSSTRERVEILDRFYATALGQLPPIHSILDVACGLHPLSIPWMPLAEDATYHAYDIYEDMMVFLNGFMALIGVPGGAQTRDVIVDCPTAQADLALVLKSIPCLEQVSEGSGYGLLDRLNARYLLVSFPVSSLGGRKKGMAANYEAEFMGYVTEKDWSIERFEFRTELAFLVTK